MKRKIVVFLLILQGAVCNAGVEKLKFLALQVILKQPPQKAYKMRAGDKVLLDVLRVLAVHEWLDDFSCVQLLDKLHIEEDISPVAHEFAQHLDVWDKADCVENTGPYQGYVLNFVKKINEMSKMPDHVQSAIWKARREGKK